MSTVFQLVFAVLFSAAAFGQAQEDVRKEVRMEDENGVKTLYIITTTKGNTTEEVYTGEEAEAKLAELMDGRGQTEEVKKEIEVTEEDGVKTVTIITSTSGKMRKEVYTGEEADAKLKELENAEKGHVEIQERKVVKKEIEEER